MDPSASGADGKANARCSSSKPAAESQENHERVSGNGAPERSPMSNGHAVPPLAANGLVPGVRDSMLSGQYGDPYSDSGFRHIIQNFTPSWFSVNMGTGIVSILLFEMPYNARWLYWLSVVVFALNVFLFVIFLILSLLRYILYPRLWRAMLRHPTQSLFLGTFPMGFATLVSMVVLVCVPAWGSWAITLAWTMWWIDTIISVTVCFYLPFVIMSIHDTRLSTMTAAWLLPIVSTIVAAATGAVVAPVLKDPQYQLWTLICSYVLWGTGVPLAMAILVIYFQRLTVYKLPPREVIVSVFLPLGPLGQGGFGIMKLGQIAMTVLPTTHTLTPQAGEILYVIGFIVALIMWGFGLVWSFFAIASISRSRFPFNMGWWGFTFPIGVFALSTNSFGRELNSTFFNVVGTIISVSVIILWMLVAAGTIARSISGAMFFAPCVVDDANKLEQPPARAVSDA